MLINNLIKIEEFVLLLLLLVVVEMVVIYVFG